MQAARIANAQITGMVLDKIRQVEGRDATKVKVNFIPECDVHQILKVDSKMLSK